MGRARFGGVKIDDGEGEEERMCTMMMMHTSNGGNRPLRIERLGGAFKWRRRDLLAVKVDDATNAIMMVLI